MTAEPKSRRIATVAAVLAVALGTMALAGLWLHIEVLRSLHSGWSPMGPNSALCFVLLGSALLLVQGTRSRSGTVAAQALALIVALLAGLSLVSFVANLPPVHESVVQQSRSSRRRTR